MKSTSKMDMGISAVIQTQEHCTYTKCYCEENVWKLCDSIRSESSHLLGCCFAVFLSNHQRTVPIWKQKAANPPNKYVIWDYHVVFLYKDATSCVIYDLDTELDFPCDLETYLKEAIGSEERLASAFHRLFRIVSAEDYLRHFASDRSHMLREDGTWMAEPPDYQPLRVPESTNNIDDFISMDPSVGWGDVVSLPELLQRLSPQLILSSLI